MSFQDMQDADERLRRELKAASKQTVRRPIAMLDVGWADVSAENADVSTGAAANRASITEQVNKGLGYERAWAYCETTDPSARRARVGGCYAMPDVPYTGEFLVGWWGAGTSISGADGNFSAPPSLIINLYPIPFSDYEIRGFLLEEYPVDFDLLLTHNGQTHTESVRGNTDAAFAGRLSVGALKDVGRIELRILKWSHRGAFVKISAFLARFVDRYETGDVVSLAVIEETDGSLGTLPVGNISSNELTVTLQNIDDKYFFGNKASILSNSARPNRRLEPFFGFGSKMLPKGVYWSSDWSVADSGTTASTTGLDRLGLLQNVQYNGLGGIHNSNADAELTYWVNQSLYRVADDVLTDLRNSYMSDLEFQLDDGLKDVIIPTAFFKSQSYFDVVRTIAQAACAFAYMDTPTAAEIYGAKERGNPKCADILRIRPLEQFISEEGVEADAETFTQDDYIDKNTSAKRSDVVNVVTVGYTEYRIDAESGKPVEVKDGENAAGPPKTFTVQSEESILEFGKITHEYKNNNLIQTLAQAEDVATRVLTAFSKTPYAAEISAFGDVTRRVGDILLVPEYQKHGIDRRGDYSVTRIETEFDGGLRQSVTCRRVKDAELDIIIDERTNSPQYIINEANASNLIDEREREA